MAVTRTIPLAAAIVPVIDRLDAVLVRLPFVSPFGTSVQTWTHKEALLLRIESGGFTAWSECVADPDPFYLPETTVSARYIIKEFLLPLVRPTLTFDQLADQFAHVRGNNMAKATLENGLAILAALQRGIPLWQLLGGTSKRIASGISIGLKDSADAMLAAVSEAVERGYHRVKIKIKKGQDIDRVAAIRGKFPALQLMVDANGDYMLDDAEHLRRLDPFGLTMIEQPLSYADIYQHSLLQKKIATPLCLDESILTLDDAATAIALGSCKILNIKQGRVGGLLASARMARFALEHELPVWSGGMDETGIGRALNIHLQTLDGFSLPGDTSETSRYFEEDIIDTPVVLDHEGFIALPEGPGLGVEVVPERLGKYTLGWERVR